MIQEKNRKLNMSVHNAFEIVNYLINKDWCRLKDISDGLKMELAKVHRLLNTMVYQDYIEYDEVTRRYRLGLRFYTISYYMAKSGSLITIAKEHMGWAADQLKETINLGSLSNSKTEVMHIYKVQGNSDTYSIDTPMGGCAKIYASALGKCIIAYRSPGEQMLILKDIKFIKYTDATITSLDKLISELHKIRLDGFAIDHGEFHPSIFCLSTPIFLDTGIVNAAISVTSMMPVSEDRINMFLEVLKETSAKISNALGYRA